MKINTIIKLAILFLFIVWNNATYAYRAYKIEGILFSYGTTFRFDKMYHHAFSIEKWIKGGGCTYSYYKGYGANFELTNKNNFNLGLKYYFTPKITRSSIGYTIGITPSIYSINNRWGVNFAPEIGIPLHFLNEGNKFGGSINLFYGYDIPVINEKSYSLNRHRLTLIIGFDLNRNFFKKQVPKDENIKE